MPLHVLSIWYMIFTMCVSSQIGVSYHTMSVVVMTTKLVHYMFRTLTVPSKMKENICSGMQEHSFTLYLQDNCVIELVLI